MTSAGRLRSMMAAACCGTLVGSLAACSQLQESAEPPSPDDVGPEACVTDLGTPTATFEVSDVPELDLLKPTSFLTADAAVVQMFEDDEFAPRVMGTNPTLQAALDDTRVWAVAGDGFLVGTPDAGADSPYSATLAIVDGRGETLVDGPHVDGDHQARAVGDQFVVVDEAEKLTAYDVVTGAEEEPGSAVVDRGLARPALASTIVLTSGGESGRVIDARSGSGFDLDDLLDQGVIDISVAGNGVDRVLLRGQVDARTSRWWTWGSASGLREVHTSDDADTGGERASLGVCDDYLYLVEDDELRVVDTAHHGGVVSRRPLTVDLDDGDGYSILAVPGGVLVCEVDGTPGGPWRYTWFDGQDSRADS